MDYEKEIDNNEKAYLVMEFYRIMHEKEEFMIIQRPIKYALEIIEENDLFPLLEKLSIHEFIVICSDIATLKTHELDTIIKGMNEKVSPDWKKYVRMAVRNAKEKAGI